jgi:hypothetical protein
MKPSLFDAEFFIVIAVIWVLIVFSLCRGDAPPHDPILPSNETEQHTLYGGHTNGI